VPLQIALSALIMMAAMIAPVLTRAQEKLKITGSINASGIAYAASGIKARRDPFYWLLSSNLTFKYRKITAPFSFTLSEQDQTFRYPQPFNQFGISPTFKSITFHAGYRNMNFSEFTLAGTTFLGAGIEINPSQSFLKGSAMYGRLAKARITGGLNDLEFGVPSYERWGYGSKITFGKNGQEIDLILFRGRDDPFSLPDSSAQNLKITPAENLVWGVNLKKSLGTRININAEYALSAYSRDIRDTEVDLTSFKYANHLGSLFSPTQSSQFNGAFQGQFTYRANSFQLNTKYRRLGPDYRTMGAPFMNNDFEDITAGVALTFIKNKMNVSSNIGIQTNNLNHNQETQVKRFIGSINVTYAFGENLNAALSYSNFNSTTTLDRFYQQSQLDQVDSLLYLQVTNNLTGSFNYQISTGYISKSLTASGTYQVASDNQNSSSVFYNGNVGYQMNVAPSNLSFNTNINFNSSQIGNNKNFSVGPTTTLSKLFLNKKIKSSLSSSYIQFYQQSKIINENIASRLAFAYTTKSKHSFGIDFSLLSRVSKIEISPSFNEFRGGFSYNYIFSN
jgi:hypothetical protein